MVRPEKYLVSILGLSVVFAASYAAPPGLTQDPEPIQRVFEQASNTQFGYSLATSAGRAIVGAPFDDDSGLDSGSAYVFDGSDSWRQLAKLIALDEAAGDQFGYSVAISGDLAIVGAWGNDDDGSASGSAYIFDRSTGWSQIAKLTASDAERGDEFGYSVAINGNLAVVGARLERDGGSASGAGYVFDGSTGWDQVTKLTASDAAANDQFGTSVAISGDLAIVGAPGDRDDGPDSGSAYLFDGSTGWDQIAQLTASDAGRGDEFGYSVAIGDDVALVGAWDNDDVGSASGSAYLFDGSTGWDQIAKLTASDAGTGDEFGYSVAISGDLAVAGARLDDDSGSASGSAYVFDRSIGWNLVAKLTESGAAAPANSVSR